MGSEELDLISEDKWRLVFRDLSRIQQILHCVAFLFQFLQRDLELLLAKRVELHAFDDREIAFTVALARIAEYQALGDTVFALGNGGDADPVAGGCRVEPGFGVIEGAVCCR